MTESGNPGYVPVVMDEEAAVASGQHELEVAMRLLSEGVPLSLLIDLATPPHSMEIYETEPGEADWLVGASA